MATDRPLQTLHAVADAEMIAWGDVPIVNTFGEPQAEYATARRSAGLIDWPFRTIVELTGPDRLAFVGNLLTQKLFDKASKSGLSAGDGAYAFLLNLRGRVVCDLNIIERGDRTWLDVDVRYADPLVKLLDAYRFGEKVQFKSLAAEVHLLAIHGPQAATIMTEAAGQASLALPITPLSSIAMKIFDVDVVTWFDDPTGLPGWTLAAPSLQVEEVWTGFINAFAAPGQVGRRRLRPLGWAMFNTLRVEGGRPIFGIDFDGQPTETAYPTKANRDAAGETGAGVLPAETGLFDRAVSITKGCYLGQEIVARMHARQQVAKKIVGLRFGTDALPIAGEAVLDDAGNEIGRITSSTISPIRSNQAMCLAMLKRGFFEPGTKVRVPAEGAIREGFVASIPFVD